MKDPVVVRIAEEKKKSPSQVLLKYLMQRNIIVLPKSVNESRIISNFQVIVHASSQILYITNVCYHNYAVMGQ